MRRLHPVRRFSVALVFLASVAAVTASGPAGAAGGTVTCDTVTGNQYGPPQMYSCSDVPETGGAASIEPYPFFSGAHTGIIYWSAATTTQPAKTQIRVHTKAVKKLKTPCPSGTTELKVSGTVRADTSGGVTVGGKVAGILCQTSTGSYTLLAGTAFVIGG